MRSSKDGKKERASIKIGYLVTEYILLRQERSLTFVILKTFGAELLLSWSSRLRQGETCSTSTMRVGTENMMSISTSILIELCHLVSTQAEVTFRFTG